MAFDLVDASIAQLRRALEAGETTCVELVQTSLDRLARFDRSGPCLNADALADAATKAASFAAFGLGEVTWSTARACIKQCAVRLYATPQDDLRARQLAPRPDHGCCRAAQAYHGRYVGNP